MSMAWRGGIGRLSRRFMAWMSEFGRGVLFLVYRTYLNHLREDGKKRKEKKNNNNTIPRRPTDALEFSCWSYYTCLSIAMLFPQKLTKDILLAGGVKRVPVYLSSWRIPRLGDRDRDRKYNPWDGQHSIYFHGCYL